MNLSLENSFWLPILLFSNSSQLPTIMGRTSTNMVILLVISLFFNLFLISNWQHSKDNNNQKWLRLGGEPGGAAMAPASVESQDDLGFEVPLTRGLGPSGTEMLTQCHRQLQSRGDIPSYLNDLGLVGEAVEIGVRRGHFSQHILHKWEGRTLHLVDPWIHQPSDLYNDISNMGEAKGWSEAKVSHRTAQ